MMVKSIALIYEQCLVLSPVWVDTSAILFTNNNLGSVSDVFSQIVYITVAYGDAAGCPIIQGPW
jgi:hypothetical protein